MRIYKIADNTLLNPIQEEVVRWALEGVQTSGWDDPDTLSNDTDVPIEEANIISPYVNQVTIQNGKLIMPPNTPAQFKEWLKNDMYYRLITQTKDMYDGLYEQLLEEGKSIKGAQAGANSKIKAAINSWEKLQHMFI